jgi:O-antigen/teichoic acid export membrane protein
MTDNSKIARNSIILFLRLIVVSIIGLVTSRLVLQALGVSDYGLFNVVGSIVGIMALLNTVLVSTTFRYIAFELGAGDEVAVNQVYNTSLVIHTTLAVVVVALSETLGVGYIRSHLNIEQSRVADALFVFRMSVAGTAVSILGIPAQGLVVAKERFGVVAVVEVTRSCLALGVALYILRTIGDPLRLYAALIAVVTIIPALVYILYTRRYFPDLTQWAFPRSTTRYREMITFSVWILFGASASVGEIQGSALLLNAFFGTLVNAAYGVANQINTMIRMFAQNVNQSAIPQITKSFGGGDTNRTNSLVAVTSKYTFFLMLIPSVPLLLECDFFLNLWLKEVPAAAPLFVRLLIVNSLFAGMNAGVPAAVQATGNIKYFQIVTSTLSLLPLPIAYFLFTHAYPPQTLFVVSTVFAMVNFLVAQILLKYLVRIDMTMMMRRCYSRIVFVGLAITPLVLIPLLFSPGLGRFVLVSVGSVVGVCIATIRLGMDRRERDFFGRQIRESILRLRML